MIMILAGCVLAICCLLFLFCFIAKRKNKTSATSDGELDNNEKAQFSLQTQDTLTALPPIPSEKDIDPLKIQPFELQVSVDSDGMYEKIETKGESDLSSSDDGESSDFETMG